MPDAGAAADGDREGPGRQVPTGAFGGVRE